MNWSRVLLNVLNRSSIAGYREFKSPVKPCLLMVNQNNLQPIRTFKDKDVLNLRCNACYFKKIDNRMWVLCNKHPRHKQRQKIENEKMDWIVTHITRTGSYKRKHFQYQHHDI